MANPFSLMAEEADSVAPTAPKRNASTPKFTEPDNANAVAQRQVTLPKLPPDYDDYSDLCAAAIDEGYGITYDADEGHYLIWSDGAAALKVNVGHWVKLIDVEDLIYKIECRAAQANKSKRLKIFELVLNHKDFGSFKARQALIETWARDVVTELRRCKLFPMSQTQVHGKQFKATLNMEEARYDHWAATIYTAWLYLDEVPAWP